MNLLPKRKGHCTRCGNYRNTLARCAQCETLVCLDCKGMHKCGAALQGRERLPEADANERRSSSHPSRYR